MTDPCDFQHLFTDPLDPIKVNEIHGSVMGISMYIFSQDGHPTLKKESLHPWNSTWNLRITQLKRKIIFQTSIFRFHVKFQRSIYGYINPYSWAFTDFFARNWVWPMKNLPFSRPFTAIAARLGIFQRGDCWEMGEVIYLDLPFVCIKSWCLFTEKNTLPIWVEIFTYLEDPGIPGACGSQKFPGAWSIWLGTVDVGWSLLLYYGSWKADNSSEN